MPSPPIFPVFLFIFMFLNYLKIILHIFIVFFDYVKQIDFISCVEFKIWIAFSLKFIYFLEIKSYTWATWTEWTIIMYENWFINKLKRCFSPLKQDKKNYLAAVYVYDPT